MPVARALLGLTAVKRFLVGLLLSSCSGELIGGQPLEGLLGSAGGGSGVATGAGPATGGGTTRVIPPPVVPVTSLRRLSPAELDRTLDDLTGDRSHLAITLLPGSAYTPFDNDVGLQAPSAIWVEAVERLAETITTQTLADPVRRAKVLPCTPASDQDLACLGRFIDSFGRRVLRRPVTAAEKTELESLHAQALERGDFMTSVALVMRRLLQDPELHFRVELGATTPSGTVTLTSFELSSRLSFFLQGRAPADWLLDAAATGALDTDEGVRAAASRLVSEPAGRSRVEEFHAMWLGFLALPHSADLNGRLVTESTALVRRVVYDEPGDYRRLFSATDTYVDATLASHYGLTPPSGTGFGWVSYGASGRKGILSHGALLSNGVKQLDTSPTLRGKWIRNRLFCQEVPAPPPNVVADVPPPQQGGAICKKDRYAVHDSVPSCAACHRAMDPLGFGLEQFDRTGAFRTAEAAHPECAIEGKGELDGVGQFTGPSGLADLMVTSGALEECTVKQLFRFANGRREREEDDGLIATLTEQFDAKGRRFDALLVDYVAHDTFRHRRLEELP